MRHLPRFALVPLAVLVSLAPFAADAVLARAGADTASDCAAAFAAAPASQLAYTTVPAARLAQIGQTVELWGRWDPSAWDGLTSAAACVELNGAFDEALGSVVAAPSDSGAFDHSFVVPADVPDGSVICTRIRLAGDPAGPATDAVWVSKTHCFEIDTSAGDVAPPGDTTPTTIAPASTTTSTTPPVQPAITPAPGSGASSAAPAAPPGFSPQGGDAAPGAPVEEAAPPAPAAASPAPASPAPTQAAGTSADHPAPAPALPATGFTSIRLLHAGERSLSAGLALLVLFGWPRRRRSPA